MTRAEPGWPDLAGRIEGGVHHLPVRVYFEDTDFSGIVYHANYLRYCERGRSDFLRLIGVHHGELQGGVHGEPLAFAVRRMEIDFLKPARIDDVLEVKSWCAALTRASMEIRQQVMRGEELLFEALVKAALLNAQGRPRRFPEPLREALSGALRAP
jgi:acyl-CoA thioester hydrolase